MVIRKKKKLVIYQVKSKSPLNNNNNYPITCPTSYPITCPINYPITHAHIEMKYYQIIFKQDL